MSPFVTIFLLKGLAMKEFFNTRNLAIIGIICLVALFRLLEHYFGINMNITPVMAVSLFGGAYFSNKKAAYLTPMIAMLLSDMVLGFHSTMFAVYGSLLLGVLLGTKMQNRISALRVAGSSLASSFLFFIITNFACWAMYYPTNFAGLVDCYTLAIPFFRTGLIGDLVWCTVLFGAFELAGKYVPALAKSETK